MRTFNERQTALAAHKRHILTWFFTVVDTSGNYYFWSTKAITADTTALIPDVSGIDPQQYLYGFNQEYGFNYEFRITGFDGLTMRRDSS